MLRSFDPSWLGLIINRPSRRKRLQDLSRVLVPLTWGRALFYWKLHSPIAFSHDCSPPHHRRCECCASLTFLMLIIIAGAASLRIQAARHYCLQTVFCFWGSAASVCGSVNTNHVRSMHPPRSLCATSTLESFMNFQLPVATSTNSCDSLSLRRGRMLSRSSCRSHQSWELRQLPFPGAIFSLVSKQCVKPCSAETVASVSLRMTEAISSPGKV